MTRTLAPIAAAMMAMGFAGPAMAASCLTVSGSPATPAIPQWNPLDGQPVEVTLNATVTRESASTKSAQWIFLDNSNATPPQIGTTGPRYEILNVSSGSAKISWPKGTSPATGVQVQFNNKNDATINIKVRILGNNGENFTGGTRFQETLAYAAQCFKANGGDNGLDSFGQSGLRLDLTIPKVLSISTSSAAEINFGNFSNNKEKAIIRLFSTSPLKVSAATVNNGKLMAGTSTADNAVIPYQMQFGVDGASLKSLPIGTTIDADQAGVGGNNYALNLTLAGSGATGKIAGTYSDTITLTITPE